MQISRLFQILYILLQKRSTTAKDLAEELEVSVRTIYRDIDHLALAGIPVYTTQGRGGGVFIPENYTFSKAYVSSKEQDEILMALQSLPVAPHLDTSETLTKIKSLFQKEHINWVEVDFSSWGNTAKTAGKFQLIKDAVLEGQLLSFHYANSQGDLSSRTVFPSNLLYKSRSWYLNGFDYQRKGYRIFKLNRMSQLAVSEKLDNTFTMPPDRESRPVSAIKLPQPASCHLIMKVSRNAVFRAYDEFDEEDIKINADGSYTICAKVFEDNWLYSYLLSFGPDAEIISPSFIRQRLTELAKKTFQIYQQT